MNKGPCETPTHLLDGIAFSLFSPDEIKALSVKEITNPETFDTLNNPNPCGLYDSALGPFNRSDTCTTCRQQQLHCPGHIGHVQLPLPVYHPIFFKTLLQIVKGGCRYCHRVLALPWQLALTQGQLRLASYGLLAEAVDLGSFVPDSVGPDGEEGASTVHERVASILEKVGYANMDESNLNTLTRHAVDFRRQLVTDFFKQLKVAKCPHCKAPVRGLRQEQGVRIFAKPLPAKVANKWATFVVDKELEKNGGNVITADLGTGGSHPQLGYKEMIDRERDSLLALTLLMPHEIREHVVQMWQLDQGVLQHVFGVLGTVPKVNVQGSPMDMFFVQVLPVAPSRFRPVSEMGERRFIHPETQGLAKIISDNIGLREVIVDLKANGDSEDSAKAKKVQYLWQQVQSDVNALMDSDLIPKQPGERVAGVRQLLEKKEGLFRRHMMGKRVNYAARSVISPDLNINADEIGIPQVFAKTLTYPQPVTSWNVQQLRKAILNGPNVHPGAFAVEMEDGSRVLIKSKDLTQRQALAKQLLTPSANAPTGTCKKVHRHLISGDVMLLNRQPTLHKPSIMAHKAYVLPGEKTIRLHYANCKCYNADFDGDEMNAHFPQNELARSEAYNIAATSHQYLVPKDGSPLSGLIQDHMVAGVMMTIRGRFFSRDEYHQLVFRALPRSVGHVRLLPPCIMKPKQLWSGKQIVSTLLLNITPKDRALLNLGGKAKIADKAWKNRKPRRAFMQVLQENEMSESEVIIRQGELLCGVLDKAHFGSTAYSLVHACFEVYGGSISSLLLSCLGKLFSTFLQLHYGFTLGVEDILVKKRANRKRQDAMAQMAQCGGEVIREAMGLEQDADDEVAQAKHEAAHRKQDGLHVVDYAMKRRTDEATNLINKLCIPDGLVRRFPYNSLQLMVQSGAKGSMVNCMQISCLLGQIELEGHRPPLMPSGRSLPSFQPYDPSPRAGGFIDGRFLTGIQPQEYFFHCMAGREGLVDTAVKTSRSGYLQRCLIKHLESLQVNYDLTVRDCDGTVVQFNYGEDSLDIVKTQFLSKKQLPFVVDNFQAFREQCDVGAALNSLNLSKASKYKRKIDRCTQKGADPLCSMQHRRVAASPFLAFCRKHEHLVDPSTLSRDDQVTGRSLTSSALLSRWSELDEAQREKYRKRAVPFPDPALSVLRPDHYYGSVCEKLEHVIDQYVNESVAKGHLSHGETTDSLESLQSDSSTTDERSTPTADQLKALVNLKYIQSLAEPGECVGLLAAQSIGEPSTQMTLNTFHFAGRGEMNVTLGIPRLREILMVASANIKTPAMDVPLRARGPDAADDSQFLKKRFTRVLLSQVLEKAEIFETLCESPAGGNRLRQYRIRLSFLPHEAYKDEFSVTPDLVLQSTEARFFRLLVANIRRVIKKMQKAREESTAVVPEIVHRPRTTDENGPDSEPDELLSDVDEEGADASSAKLHARKKQQVSYDDDDDDEEIMYSDSDSDSDSDAAHVKSEASAAGGGSGDESDNSGNTNGVPHHPSTPGARARSTDTDVQFRVRGVTQGSSAVTDYCYDTKNNLWCEVILKFPIMYSKVMIADIIERTSRKYIVHEVPGIQRCFINESKEAGENGMWRLKTEGVNLPELFYYPDIIDINKLYTNNIHALAAVYGIEAARQALVKEIAAVFKVYGIVVDYRHLSLIGDYMTVEGSYRPFNRIGIESNRSPFQKMSFETTMHFLRQATVNGDTDNLISPSARIVAGLPALGGTGCMDILQPLA
ncbi:DNA-directed RNA polymerase I subunit RPA1-like [Sycon ciliatum]|uniref:DNA-directed RNA polymerase I subunit RPA1-like n=1 Tax=Sycon ciliatum TaxID=27933 RepID=UPI0031F6D722